MNRLFLVFISFVACNLANAQTVLTKVGDKIEGQIIGETHIACHQDSDCALKVFGCDSISLNALGQKEIVNKIFYKKLSCNRPYKNWQPKCISNVCGKVSMMADGQAEIF